jgi:hypothetical protein
MKKAKKTVQRGFETEKKHWSTFAQYQEMVEAER